MRDFPSWIELKPLQWLGSLWRCRFNLQLSKVGLKDPALPQLWSRLQLWLEFNPWPGNVHMPWVWPLKNKRRSSKWYLSDNFKYYEENQKSWGLERKIDGQGKLFWRGSFWGKAVRNDQCQDLDVPRTLQAEDTANTKGLGTEKAYFIWEIAKG